jgi:hypothetical protein
MPPALRASVRVRFFASCGSARPLLWRGRWQGGPAHDSAGCSFAGGGGSAAVVVEQGSGVRGNLRVAKLARARQSGVEAGARIVAARVHDGEPLCSREQKGLAATLGLEGVPRAPALRRGDLPAARGGPAPVAQLQRREVPAQIGRQPDLALGFLASLARARGARWSRRAPPRNYRPNGGPPERGCPRPGGRSVGRAPPCRKGHCSARCAFRSVCSLRLTFSYARTTRPRQRVKGCQVRKKKERGGRDWEGFGRGWCGLG